MSPGVTGRVSSGGGTRGPSKRPVQARQRRSACRLAADQITSSVRDMLDPEASRQTAHIFLDAAGLHRHDEPADFDQRDEMTALALARLPEVGSIILTQDDDTGAITLDIARAATGIITVIIAALQGWATCAGVDRDVIIGEIRRIVDEELTGNPD